MPNKKKPTIEYKNNDQLPEIVDKNKQNIESMFKHGIADPTQVIKNTKDIDTNAKKIGQQDIEIESNKSNLGSVSATFPKVSDISNSNPINNLPWKTGDIIQISNYNNTDKESLGIFTDNDNWRFFEQQNENITNRIFDKTSTSDIKKIGSIEINGNTAPYKSLITLNGNLYSRKLELNPEEIVISNSAEGKIRISPYHITWDNNGLITFNDKDKIEFKVNSLKELSIFINKVEKITFKTLVEKVLALP